MVDKLLAAADGADKELADAITLAMGEKEDFSWKPTTADVALGGTAATEAAATDVIREIWQRGMGQNPTDLDKKILPWIEDIGPGRLKGVSGLGGAVGVLTAIPAMFVDHYHDHETWGRAITCEGTGAAAGVAADVAVSSGLSYAASAASVAAAAGEAAAEGSVIGSVIPGPGTVAGAALGAVIGSIVPGAGTAVGAVAGAALGGVLAVLASKGVQHLWGR